jgi:signal transduction histidine kinase
MKLKARKHINFLKVANGCFHRKICRAAACEECADLYKVLATIRKITGSLAVLWLEVEEKGLKQKICCWSPLLMLNIPDIIKELGNILPHFLKHRKEKNSQYLCLKLKNITLNSKRPPRFHCVVSSLALDNNFLVILGKNKKLPDAALVKECVEIIDDILRWKKMNVEFSKSNRLLLAGLMAGAVAHDLNNIIAGVLSSLQMMNYAGVKEKGLSEIRDGLMKGADILSDLLSFVRERDRGNSAVAINLNKTIDDIVPLLKLLVNKKCNLKIELPRSPLFIKAIPSKIEQILINLVINAKDALLNAPEGNIKIKLSKTLANKQLLPDLPAKYYAVMTVSDNGCGIKEENKEKIFEPFFTTKGKEKGTGLGLFIVKTIIEECGGIISFESSKNCGTTFYCHFPLVKGSSSSSSTMA